MTPVKLPELGAMMRAYPPGKRVQVHVRAGNAPRSVSVGAEIDVSEDVRIGRPAGARAKAKVVGIAWILEVTLPDEDAPPEIDPGQESLLGDTA